MSYKTLMLHLEPGRPNAALLALTGELARRFDAAVIGVSVCQPSPLVYGDGYVDGTMIEQDRQELERELKEAEADFRRAFPPQQRHTAWRGSLQFAALPEVLAREARAADLLITAVSSGKLLDASRSVDTGDLVMQAGRPVLVVPLGVATLQMQNMVVAWKDTREARRAVADALPMLRLAARVAVVEIAEEAELPAARLRLADVVDWLARHGVSATALASAGASDPARALAAIERDNEADLVVAGAYGHSRLREWVLGGVTRDLLLQACCCSLLSH